MTIGVPAAPARPADHEAGVVCAPGSLSCPDSQAFLERERSWLLSRSQMGLVSKKRLRTSVRGGEGGGGHRRGMGAQLVILFPAEALPCVTRFMSLAHL